MRHLVFAFDKRNCLLLVLRKKGLFFFLRPLAAAHCLEGLLLECPAQVAGPSLSDLLLLLALHRLVVLTTAVAWN